MRVIGYLLTLIVLTMGVATPAVAQNGERNRYKWKDAQGNLHFDDALPPEAARLGYEVVNAQGIVVKHVERAKTDEEDKADTAAAASKAEHDRTAADQARSDQQILAAYPNEGEFVSAQQQQLDMIDQNIHATEISLQSQEKSLTEMLSHAADLDRNGKPVPAPLQQQIDTLRRNIEKQKTYIASKQQEKTDSTTKFDSELAHYRTLRDQERKH
jgi:hypothetical protein